MSDARLPDDEHIVRMHWEAAIVKGVLRSRCLMHEIKTIRKINSDATGSDDLTLHAFHKRFPRFPLMLLPSTGKRLPEPTIHDLFKRFTTTEFYCEYERATRALQPEETTMPVAVVVNVQGNHLYVVYSVPPTARYAWTKTRDDRGAPVEKLAPVGPGTRIMWTPQRTQIVSTFKRPSRTFYVEHLESFLAVLKEWHNPS